MKKLLYIIPSLFLLVSCEGFLTSLGLGGSKVPVLSLSEHEYFIDSEGGSFSVTITTNEPFECESDASWVTSMNSSSTGTFKVFISVERNPGYEDRVGKLIYSNSGAMDSLIVYQSKTNAIILSPGSVHLDSAADVVEVVVRSNIEYSYKIEEGSAWVSEVKSKGLSEYRHQFSVNENDSRAQRQARIVFSSPEYEGSDIFLITQDASGGLLTVRHTCLTYTLPVFTGSGVSGTVSWGDGESSDYQIGGSHTYAADGEWTIQMEVKNAGTVRFDSIYGISHIDFSDF